MAPAAFRTVALPRTRGAAETARPRAPRRTSSILGGVGSRGQERPVPLPRALRLRRGAVCRAAVKGAPSPPGRHRGRGEGELRLAAALPGARSSAPLCASRSLPKSTPPAGRARLRAHRWSGSAPPPVWARWRPLRLSAPRAPLAPPAPDGTHAHCGAAWGARQVVWPRHLATSHAGNAGPRDSRAAALPAGASRAVRGVGTRRHLGKTHVGGPRLPNRAVAVHAQAGRRRDGGGPRLPEPSNHTMYGLSTAGLGPVAARLSSAAARRQPTAPPLTGAVPAPVCSGVNAQRSSRPGRNSAGPRARRAARRGGCGAAGSRSFESGGGPRAEGRHRRGPPPGHDAQAVSHQAG